jgi:protein O-GlcNAc transferase
MHLTFFAFLVFLSQSLLFAQSKSSAKYYMDLADSLAAQREFESAITYYSTAIQIDSGNAELFFHRANTKADLKKYADAVDDYEKAVSINPNFVPAYSAMGIAKYNWGKYEQAVLSFSSAIEKDTETANTYLNRARAYARLNNYQKALEDCEKTRRRDKMQGFFAYSTIYALMNKPKEAAAYLKRAIASGAKYEWIEEGNDFDLVRNTKAMKSIK